MSRRNRNRRDGNSEKPETSVPGTQEQQTTSGGNDKDTKCPKCGTMHSASNDPEWYAQDPALITAAGNIPFSKPFGSDVQWFGGENRSFGPIENRVTSSKFVARPIPGVCSLKIKPSFPAGFAMTTPLNVAANSLYTFVRYVNSGRKNYDPADLFMYVAAFGELYAFIQWCERLYHYAFMYSQNNWYMGAEMIRMNGVKPEEIIQNLANFRYWLNSIINKVASFAVPANIRYFQRRVFMFSGYYIENPYGNMKDALYQFVPDGFFKFKLDDNGFGMLEYSKMDTVATFNQITWYFDGLMQYITGDEDFGLMSGDILKAYGTNIITLAPLAEEGGILPIYDPYVLSQFKNAVVVPITTGKKWKNPGLPNQTFLTGCLMQSNNGNLVYADILDPVKELTDSEYSVAGLADIYLDVENPNPGVADVIEATRLISHHGPIQVLDAESATQHDFTAWSGGTELVVAIMSAYHPTVPIVASATFTSNYHPSGYFEIEDYAKLAQFKYAPFQIVYKTEPGVQEGIRDVTEMCVLSNTENLTFITNEMLVRLHEVALLSLFFVPGVAKLA